jgi:hypothetical protein
MGRSHFRALPIFIIAAFALSSCQLLGPASIDLGRDRYNNVIHLTTMEQMMSNIVRVYQHQPTLFMDVTEVDATMAFGGSLAGAATNIGARPGLTGGTLSGELGSAAGTLQYSETPTVRYQPLLGQALVSQLVTPVSVDALGLLYDSNWHPASLLDLSAAYLTLDYSQFAIALDTIIELDDRGGLQLEAAKSGLPKPPEQASQQRSAAAKSPSTSSDLEKRQEDSNDSIVLFLRPYSPGQGSNPWGKGGAVLAAKQRTLQLWVRLLRIYVGTQPAFQPTIAASRCAQLGLSIPKGQTSLSAAQLKEWDVDIAKRSAQELDDARYCMPNSIELRVVPHAAATADTKERKKPELAAPRLVTNAPLMRNYSALGILKNAVERPHPRVEFVTPSRYRAIRNSDTHPWNADVDSLNYYTLLPSDQDSIDCQNPQKGCDDPLPEGDADYAAKTQIITDWITKGYPLKPDDPNYQDNLVVYDRPGANVLDDTYVNINKRIGSLRRYVLIIVEDTPPSQATYVSYSDGRRWYYIAADDTVSQKNFHLLSLFVTMMAVPPSTQPLSPVINVGGS